MSRFGYSADPAVKARKPKPMSQYELDTGKPDLDHDLNYSYPPFARKADRSIMPSRPPTRIGENPDLSRTVNRSDELQTAQLPFRPVPYGAKKDGNGNYGYGPFASKPTETWTQRPVPDRTPPATEPGKAGQMGALRVAESRMSQAMLDTGKPGPDEFPVTPAPARIDDATLNRNINGAPGQPGMVRQRDAIITQLQALGPAYLDSRVPGQAQRRAALIAQRQSLESLGSTMAAARTPAPSVTPTQAQMGRDNLTMKTGVDVRPAREKVLAMAADFANMGDTSNAAALEARALNGEWEQRDFRDRMEKRQDRQNAAQTALTTKDPASGRSPMEQLDFDRRQRVLDGESEQAIKDAEIQANIRELGQRGKPNERTQIENDALRAQTNAVVNQTNRENAKAERDAANPLSRENADRTVQERSNAYAVSGYNPEQVGVQADTLIKGFGSHVQRAGFWTGSMNEGGVDAGLIPNVTGAMRDMDTFEANILSPLEKLASLSPEEAKKEAGMLLQKFPPTKGDGTYQPSGFVNRLHPSLMQYVERLNAVRARVRAIAGVP